MSIETRNEEAGYVEFINSDVPYIVRDIPAPAEILLDMETRQVIGYRVYEHPTPVSIVSGSEDGRASAARAAEAYVFRKCYKHSGGIVEAAFESGVEWCLGLSDNKILGAEMVRLNEYLRGWLESGEDATVINRDEAQTILKVLGFCEDEGCDHHGTSHVCISPRTPNTEVSRLRTALQFYADAWCFTTNTKRAGLEWKPKEALLDDCGERARAALAMKGDVCLILSKQWLRRVSKRYARPSITGSTDGRTMKRSEQFFPLPLRPRAHPFQVRG
ncbi:MULTISPECIES: hypothetical protein [unclassified Rhizobium]|uniref:hypothetical protein n=1 Tax=unclassified Rhizobium TaxID=2613769 RepID=UPI001ADB6053|nr:MULTISPECIES: hypothetical protein [unclassified Rhizobium]MBO9099481.1 hypothetical protein [Rhizobium sp. L58/93]QXZ87037.1 hypothetical protein J5287_20825 [Rhizobium sp. K1/93]QXZ92929.1 hypothetical protein J5280_20070 [Rhizobium sp. K15/93]